MADKGTGGEKEAAKVLLERLMQKHGITEADLEEETTRLEWFQYKDELQMRLLHQVIYAVLGDRELYKWAKSRKKQVGVYCTIAEKIEIEVTFEFYCQAMQEELDLFLKAFCLKNNLFPSFDVKPETDTHETEISDKELNQIFYMMKGMKQRTFRKMIESNQNSQEGTTAHS